MKERLFRIIFLMTVMQPLSAAAVGLSPFAELLVLHASQETSSTWVSVIRTSGKTLDFDATDIDFGWHSGFRGGFAYQLEQNCWDTALFWTHFSANTNKRVSTGDQIILPEFFSGFLSGNFFFGAGIDWRLAMNMVDFQVGRKFNVIEDSLTIRPSFGIKGGTLQQNINASWDAGIYTATEKLKHHFSGVGPSFGIDCKWNLCGPFSICGDFSTAFMWGNWKVKDTYTRPSALFGLVTPTTITTSLNNTKLGTLMFRYRLGLEWIYEGRFPLSFLLGYEMQFWPNQLRLPTFQQLPLHGGLTLQGGTCQIRLDL